MALHPYFKSARHESLEAYARHRRSAAGPNPDSTWSAKSLCAAYGWPANLAGGGRIAIIELGGAYSDADTAEFCAANGIPAPTVRHVYVGGGAQTSMSDDASVEVALDVQISAASYAIATGHAADITIYWGTDIAPCIDAAAKDGCDVFSNSWGDDEANWGIEAAAALEASITAAAASGMAFFAASGDGNSSDGGTTPKNVDLPAGCPHAIGCGGTRMRAASEVVWDDGPTEGTGGGFSGFFPAQAWQTGAPVPPAGLGRMVPDVAANADPNTGYNIVANGQAVVVGGTSAVAPLYAGLFAAFGPKLGWVTPKLWLNPGCFKDITSGNNVSYSAVAGPDACTGLGSPHGALVAALFHDVATSPPPIPAPPPVPTPLPPVIPSQLLLSAVSFARTFEIFSHEPAEVAFGGWMIGYGSLLDGNGQRVTSATPAVSKAEAESLIQEVMFLALAEVGREVTNTLTTNEIIALADFVYSNGPGKLVNTALLQALNAGNHNRAAELFLTWDKNGGPGGPIVPSMLYRRAAEIIRFLGY